MVVEVHEYKWSSYPVNAMGKSSNLCTPHQLYLGLGGNKEERQVNYKEMFKQVLDENLLKELRSMTQKGLAFGRADFIEPVEMLSMRRAKIGKLGRPRKENVL